MERTPTARLLGITTLVALLAWPAGALATTITVNTTVDLPATPGQCQGVPGDCSIRRAVDEADTSQNDTIVVPAGTYILSGPISIPGTMTVSGAGARTTTVNGNGNGSAFTVTGSGSATISGMTITSGHRVGASFTSSGGGITDQATSLTLDRVNLSGSTLETNAGGGAARGAGINVNGNAAAVLLITNSTIANNHKFPTPPVTTTVRGYSPPARPQSRS